jgi:hypothetical protein
MAERWQATTLPVRPVVASFPEYAQAQRAMDSLPDEKFPVERVAIVGEGLCAVEQVTGHAPGGRPVWTGCLAAS